MNSSSKPGTVERALPLYRGRYLRALKGLDSPRKAIGTKCLECCAWQIQEARACAISACPLWAYNPWKSGAEAGAPGGAPLTSTQGPRSGPVAPPGGRAA